MTAPERIAPRAVERNGVDEEQGIEPVRVRRWPRRVRRALAVLLVLLVLAVGVAWLMRERLATDYIEGELARRGVQASYDVKRIGFGSQILENLVIGDPARPDAIIRRAEIGVRFGLGGPEIGLIIVRGVRLFGRIRDDGTLTLGQIDRLLPEPSGRPFALPGQRIDVDDSAITLESPWGRMALALTGRGNLADGFRGQMAMRANDLRFGQCTVLAPRADVGVAVDDLRPTVTGPVGAARVDCDSLALARPLLALNATFEPALDGWRGASAMRLGSLATDAARLANVEGRLTFAGTKARTQGRADLAAAAVAGSGVNAGRTAIVGPYALSLDRGEVLFSGGLHAAGIALPQSTLAGLAGSLRATRGTPLGPIGERLADSLVRAGQGGAAADGDIRLAIGRGYGAARVDRLRLTSASGARLLSDGGTGATYFWPNGGLRLDGDFALSGGGFPDARFTLRQAGANAPLDGIGRIAPLAAGNARLALGPIAFKAAPDGNTRFRTVARLDGPFGGGQVRGLTMPLAGRFGRGGFVLGEGCVAAGFDSLQIQNLRLGASRLPLCPVGPALVWQGRNGVQAGAELRAPRFAGRLGSSPITLAASRVRVDMSGLAVASLAARLQSATGVNSLDIASLDGRFANGGVAGAFRGLAGDLAGVPLLVSEGAGAWRFANGTLIAEGGLMVADRQEPLRFQPLAARDFRLSIAGSDLRATGVLTHPVSGTRVANATIVHNLSSGAGNAVLDVEGLTFTPAFQPDALTPLTVGVVALVDATLSGQGRIAWDAEGTRSSGTFTTAGANLAAPFGPVQGLATTIEFTDLLGLTSAPGQVARVAQVQAGIDVFDGEIRYQLQPDYRVAVESARWPYAGGTLTLDPTVLDFSRETTKYLTFRVEGLDAARFVEQMEFGNIAATGTFDGVIPMQFDETGAGRIVNGRLAARPEGGTLSYIGELTDQDLGAYGILAFNALKSLRYDKFDLTLDGALDGEFITVIDLDGVARDPSLTTLPSGGGVAQIVAGRVLRQLARIPFQFNIRVQGQFRSLIATTRSFSDPTPLIQSLLSPDGLTDPSTNVQTEESEPVR